MHDELGRTEKPQTLMDMATIFGRYEQACQWSFGWHGSVWWNQCLPVKLKWMSMVWKNHGFSCSKNETHNHPTEIEPFGGAATWIGGAIRTHCQVVPTFIKPYVSQVLVISQLRFQRLRAGKLPQQVISKTAAHGYSSYGNKLVLAITYVRECFHPGFGC